MAPMAESRRNRSNRPPKASPPLTGSISVDDETAAALALFNARLVKQAEDERATKRVERATRAKDAAAAKVRELEKDTKATAEQRTEAADEYRQALHYFDISIRKFPDHAGANFEIAYFLANCPATQFQDPQRAARHARRALQQAPEYAELWRVLGISQYQLNNWAAADEAFAQIPVEQ